MKADLAVWRPVAWTRVTVNDGFWSPRQARNAAVTLPQMYQRLVSTGRLAALSGQWRPGMPQQPHQFWDSDVAKWLEAAAYALVTHPDPGLQQQAEEVAGYFRTCQMPDGYLHSYHQLVAPEKRWTNLRDDHELYCMGHFIEAAVALYEALGDRDTLATAVRVSDHLATVFGRGPGQQRGYCGHEEIELALVKLYRVTGERRHLELASYFIEERGQNPHYFHQEAQARGDEPSKYWAKTYSYCQAHLPVREQLEVTGHAVRAMYLYCAMADLAEQTSDASLLAACQRLHRQLVDTRLYLTGGIGSVPRIEGFSVAYDLPVQGGYSETCASIAHRRRWCLRRPAGALPVQRYPLRYFA
jgi:uncharacterized protein